MTSNETLTINGINYEVVKAETAATYEARGLVNIASALRQNGISRDLTVRRPNGRVHFMVVEHGSSNYGDVLRIPGRW